MFSRNEVSRKDNPSSTQVKRGPTKFASSIKNWWNSHKEHTQNVPEEDTQKKTRLAKSLNQSLGTTQMVLNFDGSRPIFSLKAPAEVVIIPSISRPFWPAECTVVSDAIKHIEWEPERPEPFYKPTGFECEHINFRSVMRRMVYCIEEGCKQPNFTNAQVVVIKPTECTPPPIFSPAFPTLEFESRFESGNLQKAVQVGPYHYELTLRTDMYTEKHTQWFYFRVRNMRIDVNYRFTIVNFTKPHSLYQQGLKPLIYSETAAKEKGIGWTRTGHNIHYYCNLLDDLFEDKNNPTHYSLTWTLQFPYDRDTCYMAQCYPYTYSKLQDYLRQISSNPEIATYCKLRMLCYSLAGNPVYILTITSPVTTVLEVQKKKAVVVTARVHPGETNGSWMMEGFLKFLLGSSKKAKQLRDTFVFKVIPMLNPDGVIVGNSRCSLSGYDLNRFYKSMRSNVFPCVFYTREMVEKLMVNQEVVLYCDFHGHSRKKNVFMYGCSDSRSSTHKFHEKVFPLMMSKNTGGKFCFPSCNWKVDKEKEGTGRVTMWRLGIKNSFTMEASIAGTTMGDGVGTHFTTRDLETLGFYFCLTLLDYYDADPTERNRCLEELGASIFGKRFGKEFSSKCRLLDFDTSTSGSISCDSGRLSLNEKKQFGSLDMKKEMKTVRSREALRAKSVNYKRRFPV
ncbi:cytosolic carboxypeptidase 2 [Synchiropus splendidus]|uniref:cytosolic carboxypeptidase 2 n=1 Tax=Synchiropus splendidus TaxID=270530 RepID=UPI00237D9755|nr:cytosolic carboxypeptidase 2 [Synchiropus splendidus]